MSEETNKSAAKEAAEETKKPVKATTEKASAKKKTKKVSKPKTPAVEEKVADEVAVESPVVVEEPQETPDDFLANFDWHKYEEGIEAVDEENIKAFEKALEGTLGLVNEREVIEGTVVRKTDREVIIDINSKSEGVISLNEFRYNPGIAVGDVVEVLVDKREDSTGQLVLSHKKARVIKAWDRVNNAHETGEVINGFVKCRTRGGMIVDIF
ncbi:MAG: S1 RNA-binding domain-containing protein, partial [Lutibacter sp.]|nr:S1 RNA-binding domain-containing protein [Lutibacter sp.]